MCSSSLCVNSKNDCQFFNPELYICGDKDRKRFESYQKQLSNESDIKEVWRWYTNDFFPFDLDIYIDAIDNYLPERVGEFAIQCDNLRAPVILKEVFSCIRRKYGDNILFEFMAKAHNCSYENDKEEWVWDTSFIAAPIMLDFLFEALLQDYPIGIETDENKISEYTQTIGNILVEREDGYFLIWNYVKYLLSSNIKNQEVLCLFLDNICQVCRSIIKKAYGDKDWRKSLRPKNFGLKKNRDRFAQTGLLGRTGKESMYMNIITQMQFYEREKIAEYILDFEDSLLLEDENFKAFSTKPLLCHYYISDAYLTAKDPVQAWHNTWEKMAPARHRLWFNRYDEFSISISRNVNFLLIVGIALMEQLHSSKCDADEGEWDKLCNDLLEILSDLVNRMGDNVSQLYHEMLDYLVTRRFMLKKATANDEIACGMTVEYILRNNWHPRRLLESLSLLKNNGFEPVLYDGDEHADIFYKKVLWATDFAIDKKNVNITSQNLDEILKVGW